MSGLPKRGPGRPPGSPNKITADIRDAILKAFEEVGGSAYLVAQANSNPQAFMALLGKILPKDMTLSGPDGGAVVIKRIIIDPKAPDSAERIRDRHPDAEGVPPGA